MLGNSALGARAEKAKGDDLRRTSPRIAGGRPINLAVELISRK
jgi:hypothetical protein